MLPGKEQGHSPERKEGTWKFQEKKVGMAPEKGRKNMDALGTEGWDGPKEGTGTFCDPRPVHLHPAAAQQQSTAPTAAPRSLPFTSHRPRLLAQPSACPPQIK